MESEQNIYPGELAALLAFLVLPALLVALAAQFSFLLWRGLSASKALASLLATTTLSIAITAMLFFFASDFPPHSLGIQNINVMGQWFPVMPLSFAVAAVVSFVVSCWSGRQRA